MISGPVQTGEPPPGREGGWESEPLRVFNTRQESGNGTRELRAGSRSVPSIWDQKSETGSRSPGDSYPEMGGVWLAVNSLTRRSRHLYMARGGPSLLLLPPV